MLNEFKIKGISRSIYGIIIVTALIVTLENYVTDELKIIGSIFSTVLLIALAESYVTYIRHKLTQQRFLKKEEIKHILKEEFTVMIGSELPILMFLLSFMGFISLEHAFLLAKMLAVSLLFIYGFWFCKLCSLSLMTRIGVATFNGLIGLAIIALKVIFH